MSARLQIDLAHALSAVQTIQRGDYRTDLHGYLPAPIANKVNTSTDPIVFARRLVRASVETGELGCVLRWVRSLEDDSQSMRRALLAADPLLALEEARLFGLPESDAARRRLAPLRSAMSAMPYHRVEHAYQAAIGGRLPNDSIPGPTTAWEALLDIYDLAAGLDGRRPVERFASLIAETAEPELVELLRTGLSLPPDTGPAADPPAGPCRPRVKAPGRLIMQVRRSPADPDLFELAYWTVLSPVCGAEPEFSSRDVVEDVSLAGVRAHLNALLHKLESQPQRRNHDCVRLELLVPMALVPRFHVAEWELESSILDEPPRIGSQVEVILRIYEFVAGQDEYGASQGKCIRRWEILEEHGEGIAFDRARDTIPPGVRFSERFADERIVVFVAGSPEEAAWRKEVVAAVYSGVPVIVWRGSDHTQDHATGSLFTGREGRVSPQELHSLPHRLLEGTRRGPIRHTDHGFIGDNIGTSVVYHDRLPVLAAAGDDYSTVRIR